MSILSFSMHFSFIYRDISVVYIIVFENIYNGLGFRSFALKITTLSSGLILPLCKALPLNICRQIYREQSRRIFRVLTVLRRSGSLPLQFFYCTISAVKLVFIQFFKEYCYTQAACENYPAMLSYINVKVEWFCFYARIFNYMCSEPSEFACQSLRCFLWPVTNTLHP